MTPEEEEEEIAALKAENAQQRQQLELARAQNALLLERVRELEARLAKLAKDRHNSHQPPSSDGLKHQSLRTRSLRRRSGKKPGGQLGHPGETLHLVAPEAVDVVVEHRPTVCTQCQTPLGSREHEAAPIVPIVRRDRRQVQDLPPIRLQVTEPDRAAYPLPRVRARNGRRISCCSGQSSAIWLPAAGAGCLSGRATTRALRARAGTVGRSV